MSNIPMHRAAAALAVVFIFPRMAFGADLPSMPRIEPVVDEPGYLRGSANDPALYVRGDVGIGAMRIGGLSQKELLQNGGSFTSRSIGSMPFVGAGLGVKINSWFRVDLTGEYRGTARVSAMDSLTMANAAGTTKLQSNTLYGGHFQSNVGLVNAYFDLGNWSGITPFIGAGVGVAMNKASGFTEQAAGNLTISGTSFPSTSMGVLGANSKTRFAWAAMAGVSYDISASTKFEIAYRHLNLGKGVASATGPINCYCGTVASPLQMKNISSDEIRIGLRWYFEPQRQPQPMARSLVSARY